MADRGDILLLKSRLGFGESADGPRVVVVQSTPLNAILPTTVVVPLDASAPPGHAHPLLVTVSAAEAGTAADQVAYPTHLRVIPTDRFAPGRVGALKPRTLAELDERIRMVLDL